MRSENRRTRQARQLLLALLGEFVLDRVSGPVRAGVLLEVLEGAGVAAPAARATLDRMVRTGFLDRIRLGREIAFSLTSDAEEVLREAADRVHAPRPFDPVGTGWTLVTFSVSEDQRNLRHRLRATLSWEGFAPLRDGLWLAPGEVDLVRALGPLREDLPGQAVTAFRARDLEAFPVSASVREAWDIDAIRGEHESFLEEWSGRQTDEHRSSRMSALTELVADWLSLLRADPRLPQEFLEPAWPADRSLEVYRARRSELAAPAIEAFQTLLGGDVGTFRGSP